MSGSEITQRTGGGSDVQRIPRCYEHHAQIVEIVRVREVVARSHSGVLSWARGVMQVSGAICGVARDGRSARRSMRWSFMNLLVHPDGVGFLDEGVLFLQFTRNIAERCAGDLREV
jgi:hypothetical protein